VKSSAFSIHLGLSGFCRWLGADSEGHLHRRIGRGTGGEFNVRPADASGRTARIARPRAGGAGGLKESSQFRAAGHQASACRQSPPPSRDRRPRSRSRPIRCSTRANENSADNSGVASRASCRSGFHDVRGAFGADGFWEDPRRKAVSGGLTQRGIRRGRPEWDRCQLRHWLNPGRIASPYRRRYASY
jgi:hypothetical protein